MAKKIKKTEKLIQSSNLESLEIEQEINIVNK